MLLQPRFISIFRQSYRDSLLEKYAPTQYHGLPWIASPLSQTGDGHHFYRHSDATPIELFFDLFFVANLSTFTATHQINNVHALCAYIGFLGVIWFTWLQVTLFDVRFARDSVFERVCKAIQLAAMVGFASAGSRFSTSVREENAWAFQSLTLILAGSRALLAIQYTVTIAFLHRSMRSAAWGVSYTALVFWVTTLFYLVMYLAFSGRNGLRPRIWSVWFVLFGVEMWTVTGLSLMYRDIGFRDTHLNTRMGLLTLMIIGEGVISITRIVNKTVRPGGWTKWSFVHILGVTTNVVYFDVSPRHQLGKFKQQLWAQLHFPFHVVLILLLEGSQILALTLDVTLKLKYLRETLLFVCEAPRPSIARAVALIRSTIDDMEIPFSRGATQELAAISSLLEALALQPLCPDRGTFDYEYTADLFNDLTGNVTAALFSSMEILPKKKIDISLLTNQQLLEMYMKLLAFVYIYFFVVASICMGLLAAFQVLSHRHEIHFHRNVSMTVRIFLAISLASLVSFASYFPLAYSFMTSPIILYAFTLTLLLVLLVDRLLDHFASGRDAAGRRNGESGAELECPATTPGMVEMDPIPVGKISPSESVSRSMTERESIRRSGELVAMQV